MTDTAGRLLRLLPLLTARPSWRGDELAGIPFTPLEPPELRERCAVLAGRLNQAAHRYPSYPAEEPAHD